MVFNNYATAVPSIIFLPDTALKNSNIYAKHDPDTN
jgi:hypothetical protein